MSIQNKSPFDSLPTISEINLTPLMDLTFILLITFIITFPLIENGIPLTLPKGDAETLAPDERPMTIDVDSDGNFYLNNGPVAVQEEDLVLFANDLSINRPGATVYVRGDKDAAFGHVVKVLQILHNAEISQVAIVTEPESK